LRERALESVALACHEKLAQARAYQDADSEFRRTIQNAAELGCSYAQIAKAAGISIGRVGQIVKAGRR